LSNPIIEPDSRSPLPKSGINLSDLGYPLFELVLKGSEPDMVLAIFSRMPSNETKPRRLAPIWRAMVEVGFIVFLFYSNLMMGEFERTNARGKSLIFALEDVFTFRNFAIAVVSGLIGYLVVEYLRKRV